jgi:LemA protein
MAIALGIIVVLIALAVLSLIGVRNGIIRERNRCQEAWSDIDVQLKRRHDLVPNLAETVKGYATHEREVFEKVSETRAGAMAAHGAGRSAQAEEQLTAALADLRAVAENYPQLRATENFQQLAGALTEIETQIQASRSAYNADVQAYNTKIQVFPNSIVARWGGFLPMEFFAIGDGAEGAPVAVNFQK